ncbi:MAG: DUF2378 family protein [Archangium sp.]
MAALRVTQSAFEGLYQHAITPDETLRAALREAGFDLHAQKPEYPAEVWKECLRITARHLHPSLPHEEALRRLGRVFIDGFFKTIIGRIASTVVSMVGPDVVLRRARGFFMSSAPGLAMTIEERGRHDFMVRFYSPITNPEFDSTVLLTVVERAGAKNIQSQVVPRSDGFDLSVRW